MAHSVPLVGNWWGAGPRGVEKGLTMRSSSTTTRTPSIVAEDEQDEYVGGVRCARVLDSGAGQLLA
eukprot:4874509-Alexandrium_andersonii.AAC.1